MDKKKECRCKSGKPVVAQYDGFRVFLFNTCEDCEAEEMERYFLGISEIRGEEPTEDEENTEPKKRGD